MYKKIGVVTIMDYKGTFIVPENDWFLRIIMGPYQREHPGDECEIRTNQGTQ